MQYTCLSKWIIFLVYIHVEPLLVFSLNFIPLIAIGLTLLKLRILSLESDFHLSIYDKFFYHLHKYDIFSFLVEKSAKYFVLTLQISIKFVVEGILKRGGVGEENLALEDCKKVLLDAVKRIE